MSLKVCTKCKKEYPNNKEYFYRSKNGKSGLHSWCKKCFYKDIRNRKGKEVEKWKKYNKQYYEDNKKHLLELQSEKYKKNPEKYKDRILRYMFGISLKEYNQMLKEQNETCAICGCKEVVKLNEKIKDLCVDHDHKNNQVRGILCHRCNWILGHVNDNPFILIKMINYLKN